METKKEIKNGYTQINIGGKLRGWKWGLVAAQKYASMVEKLKRITESGELGIDDFVYVVYAGLFMNCFVKQVDQDFTFEDVCEWMETLDKGSLIDISKAIESSQSYQKAILESKEAKEDIPLVPASIY